MFAWSYPHSFLKLLRNKHHNWMNPAHVAEEDKGRKINGRKKLSLFVYNGEYVVFR